MNVLELKNKNKNEINCTATETELFCTNSFFTVNNLQSPAETRAGNCAAHATAQIVCEREKKDKLFQREWGKEREREEKKLNWGGVCCGEEGVEGEMVRVILHSLICWVQPWQDWGWGEGTVVQYRTIYITSPLDWSQHEALKATAASDWAAQMDSNRDRCGPGGLQALGCGYYWVFWF